MTTTNEDAGPSAPIPMVLFCPACGTQHIDAPEPESGWENPPHKSHLCHACQTIWRPADVATAGVPYTQTIGEHDNWPRIKRAAPSKVQVEAVRATCVPPEVTAALDRMCTPLDPSVLTGATAFADAHSMQVIRNYILETARSGWISIGERMPEPDEPVLVHNGRWTGVGAWMSGEYLEDIERWQDEHREFIEMNGPAVTHWMPLPEAPDAAAASGGEKV
jgi:hypothetical protein